MQPSGHTRFYTTLTNTTIVGADRGCREEHLQRGIKLSEVNWFNVGSSATKLPLPALRRARRRSA